MKPAWVEYAIYDVRFSLRTLSRAPGFTAIAVSIIALGVGATRSPKSAMEVLVVAGIVIFPMTRLLLHAMSRSSSLPRGHPMNVLALQVAFVLLLCLPLVFAATTVLNHGERRLGDRVGWSWPNQRTASESEETPAMILGKRLDLIIHYFGWQAARVGHSCRNLKR